MNLASVFMFVVSVVGLTHVIVDSAIMENPRNLFKKIVPEWFGSVVDCYMCCGVWCGWFVASVLFPVDVSSHYSIFMGIMTIFVSGFAGSYLSNFAAIQLNHIEAATLGYLEQEEKESNDS